MYWRTVKKSLIVAYDRIGILAVMNMAFVLASLPILTLPLTIPMLSSAVLSVARGEKISWREPWRKAGRHYLRGGFLLLSSIAITAVLVADLFILERMKQGRPEIAYLLMGFVLCLLAIWLLMQLYVLPLFLREELAVFGAFKKALLLVLGNFAISAAFGLTLLGFVLVMILSGVGPFVIMVSFVFLVQHLLLDDLMERYDGQR